MVAGGEGLLSQGGGRGRLEAFELVGADALFGGARAAGHVERAEQVVYGGCVAALGLRRGSGSEFGNAVGWVVIARGSWLGLG